jgi:hypothetical protein
MAIIVLQHTSMDNFDVDPSYSISTSGRIVAGTLVSLNSSGFVVKADNTSGTNPPIGLAGDSLSDEYKTTPFSASLIIGRGQKIAATGKYKAPTRFTSVRVSDFYNETLASGKMSVYTGSGRFGTDQYVLADSWTGKQGAPVYSNASGLFTLTQGSARQVGFVVAPPANYPSGVPGADVPVADGSMSLGTFLQVSLSI